MNATAKSAAATAAALGKRRRSSPLRPAAAKRFQGTNQSHVVACPLCAREFHHLLIESHSATCNGLPEASTTSKQAKASEVAQGSNANQTDNVISLIQTGPAALPEVTADNEAAGLADNKASPDRRAGPGAQQSCLQKPTSKLLQLTADSWMRVEGRVLQSKAGEFEALWGERPGDPQHIMLFGRKCNIARRHRLYVVGEGTSYSYSGITVSGQPITNPVLLRALDIAQRASPEFTYNGILVNWYEGGEEGMGAHSDDERDLMRDAPIYSFSLGAPRIFRIHTKKPSNGAEPVLLGAERKSTMDTWVNDGDLVVMGGRMQDEFKHSVPKGKSFAGRRINLTVRAFQSKINRK